MDIYLGQLINWVLQKSSTLIGQLATVHNCDWLTKDKRIYKISSISPWVKWPSGEEARFWSAQLDSLELWLADKISYLVCPITIQVNQAEQTKSMPPRQKAI